MVSSVKAAKSGNAKYYRLAGIDICLLSDLPFSERTFHPKFREFESVKPARGEMVLIKHHFSLPLLDPGSLGTEVYNAPPWVVYRSKDRLVYKCVSREGTKERIHNLVLSDICRSRFDIYHADKNAYLRGGAYSLTLLPSDQILLAGVLSSRRACYIHACGIIYANEGLLFAGHSGAGKTTLARMFSKHGGQVLCDDRIVVRRLGGKFRIYGTWNNGELQRVSRRDAILKGIFFLRKAGVNRIIRIENKKETFKRLSACLIKSLQTVSWWENTLPLLEQITRTVPAYVLEFDKKGKVVELFESSR
ncbi:MAG: hypothetical protein WBE75_00565 [Candidatus Omnitrophota bacterium]|jgi:hypothetical protein